LGLHNTLPAMTVLLTGTGIVPPDSFTLRDADVVEISSPAIGFLRNPVKRLL
jgi:2-dehydro-3-deoxy-D-arabinonate dehydratase